MHTVVDISERTGQIESALRTPVDTEHVRFRGRYHALPVVKLPLSLPVFRVANGRITVLKADYLRVRGLGPEFFDSGQEVPDVQQALHELLLPLSKRPEGPIYQELRDSRLQTEPLLLTADGVVVNGNRRLAAMRSLFSDDPKAFSEFAEVQATVLPADATEAEIEMVEAALQMAPETKLAYGWIDRRLKLRRHRDELGLAPKLICETYRLTSQRQLDEEIEELALAETYLEDYLERPGEYAAVDYAEPFFSGLREQLANLKSPRAVESWRLIGFALIREAPAQEIEPTQLFPFTAPNPPLAPRAVLERYGEELGLWPPHPNLGMGHELKETDYELLHVHLSRPDDSAAVAKAMTRLFHQVAAEYEERVHPNMVINRLKNISKVLSRVDLSSFNETQRRELFGQLAEIDFHFRNLRGDGDSDERGAVVVLEIPRKLQAAGRRVSRWFGRDRSGTGVKH